LLRIAAVATDFWVDERGLTAHSRPSVWEWSTDAEPAGLVEFARIVLDAAREL
jgi:hypothetical protein